MKKLKLFTALAAAAMLLTQIPMTASAGELTRDELIEKYSWLMQSEEGGGQTWYYEAHGDSFYQPVNAPEAPAVVRSGAENGLSYDVLEDGTVRINGLDDSIDPETAEIIIPAEIEGCPVTEIGKNAFRRVFEALPAIRKIQLPDSIETVNECAFEDAFCDARDEKPADAWINIPANVKFIGFEAYYNDLYAIANAQGGSHIIRLPESLEYISYTAFGWIAKRYKGGYDIDMPESLVFMSDYFFSDFAESTAHGGIWKTKWIQVVDTDTIRPEDLPLIMNECSDNFYLNERNIVTMGDLCGQKEVIFPIDGGMFYNNPMGYETSYERMLASAAVYAPDLLPENVKAGIQTVDYLDGKTEVSASGDVDLNGLTNIADAVLLARFLAEDAEINVTAEGKANADLNADGNLTGADQTLLLELIANVNA